MTQQAQTTGIPIRTQWDVECFQTGQIIEKGSLCIWYKATGRTYHINSPVGLEFTGRGK